MAKKEIKKKVVNKPTKKIVEETPIEVQEFEEAASLEVVEATAEEPEVEVVNGDPAVIAPVEEPEPEAPAIEEPTTEEPVIVNESDIETVQPVEAKVEEKNNRKDNMFKRMFGYIWNGQEMDY